MAEHPTPSSLLMVWEKCVPIVIVYSHKHLARLCADVLSGDHCIKLLEELTFRVHLGLRTALAGANCIGSVQQEKEAGQRGALLCGNAIFLHYHRLSQGCIGGEGNF